MVYFPPGWRAPLTPEGGIESIAENDSVGLMIANNIDLKANTKIVEKDFQVVDDKATEAARAKKDKN